LDGCSRPWLWTMVVALPRTRGWRLSGWKRVLPGGFYLDQRGRREAPTQPEGGFDVPVGGGGGPQSGGERKSLGCSDSTQGDVNCIPAIRDRSPVRMHKPVLDQRVRCNQLDPVRGVPNLIDPCLVSRLELPSVPRLMVQGRVFVPSQVAAPHAVTARQAGGREQAYTERFGTRGRGVGTGDRDEAGFLRRVISPGYPGRSPRSDPVLGGAVHGPVAELRKMRGQTVKHATPPEELIGVLRPKDLCRGIKWLTRGHDVLYNPDKMRKVVARMLTRRVTDLTIQVGNPALDTIRNATFQFERKLRRGGAG